MSLTINLGGTPSVTGGTATTFTETSRTVVGGKQYSNMNITDYRVRPTVTVTSKLPAFHNGVWAKGKYSLTYTVPIITASGAITYNNWRQELEVHPEFSDVDAALLRSNGVQFGFDTDLTNFWKGGSLIF